MQIAELSKAGVLSHYQDIAGGNVKSLADDLRELSPNKLKDVCLTFGVSIRAGDKATIIKDLAKTVATVSKEAEEDADEPEIEPVTSAVMPRGTKGPTVELQVNPAFLKLIPRPSEEDRKRTKASIEDAFAKGGSLSQRIKVRPGVHPGDPHEIIDGHTRYEILQELGISITEDLIEILTATDEQVKAEICRLNFDRRHLTDAEKIQLAKQFLPQIKAVQAEATTDRAQAIKIWS